MYINKTSPELDKFTSHRDKFTSHRVYIPKSIDSLLDEYARTLDVSKSRLIAIALDNEIVQSDNPFQFFKQEDIPFVAHDAEPDITQIRTLGKYLIDIKPKGLAIETYLLARRDFGVETMEEALKIIGWFKHQDETMQFYYPKQAMGRNPNNFLKIRCPVERAKHKTIKGVNE